MKSAFIFALVLISSTSVYAQTRSWGYIGCYGEGNRQRLVLKFQDKSNKVVEQPLSSEVFNTVQVREQRVALLTHGAESMCAHPYLGQLTEGFRFEYSDYSTKECIAVEIPASTKENPIAVHGSCGADSRNGAELFFHAKTNFETKCISNCKHTAAVKTSEPIETPIAVTPVIKPVEKTPADESIAVKFSDDQTTVSSKLKALGCLSPFFEVHGDKWTVDSSTCKIYDLQKPCPAGTTAKWYDEKERSFKVCIQTSTSESKQQEATH